ncbi:hypothetical protein GLYMA_05G134200v4 [Glycine max]|nr:uncharacterized protein LOC100806319 [Glycine max]KAG4391146.1 hypothetical protein GLYMA_05G134200v4 [Glycine max]KAH1134182.1 hypothetical protein GYH30_012550 [Glycine max]KAH1250509.1 hypothetical protein GmHk_05G013649 [Glycine max]|eukprot:XP_006580066.1 uncharacterized protein LOC100806319 isoform X1 [Glycine max]
MGKGTSYGQWLRHGIFILCGRQSDASRSSATMNHFPLAYGRSVCVNREFSCKLPIAKIIVEVVSGDAPIGIIQTPAPFECIDEDSSTNEAKIVMGPEEYYMKHHGENS